MPPVIVGECNRPGVSSSTIVATGDPDLSVEEVHHVVDSVERAVVIDFPMITRIVGHAEPPRKAPHIAA
jgi:divalent metal cation (Fe/Co/Zn/Cd) transporter